MVSLQCRMTAPVTEADLLRRIAEDRDRTAFAQLFRGYAPRIAGLFGRGGMDATVRDELVQETMLRVWRHAHRYDPARASVTTWVFTIARNVRIDHYRKRRVEADPLDPAYVDDTTPAADEVVASLQDAQRVRAAVAELPPEQASILHAAYFEHRTLREIAEADAVPLGTVKSRVRLAFKRLRETFGGPS